MTSREVLKLLRQDGWYVKNQKGSHLQLVHDEKPGKVTVPMHSGDLSPGALNSILKQAGLKN
ncbi:addiction module toxin, HicA family protein [Dyadobacter beijingensis]|uniref:Addiction module toxin, HicA family protein n=1 Tax=Dyadobacter beijingensis TaxID=365489 RepID=A0ABQ2I4Y2_9BACT|nr:type II toxin-antitoxin system HicA family toxin [Dyadobacter beijingensis]GGN00666.1 addiction module toxin, HicA family protein [Dyadobacter beijingensis]